MSKILITGVAGLLGSHFSTYLLNKGHDVFGIDNMFGGYKEYIDDRLLETQSFAEIDLIEEDLVNGVFDYYKPDYVYHFAAYAAEGLSPFIRNFNYQNNVLCSVNIINNCINYDVKKMIFTSSMAVYGFGNPPFNETQSPSPIDPYGIAKYTVEMDLKQAKEQFNLNYNIIRPHNVVGTKQNIWDRYRNVIGIWIRKCLNNENITIFGDGEQKRAFSDIKYYMKPFEILMKQHDNETFNIGADREYKIVEVAKIVQKVAKENGYVVNLDFLEPRHEVKNAYCDHTKAKNMLDFSDDTNIESMIREMFVWAMNEPNRNVKNMNYEVTKKLYSYWK